MDGFRSTPHHAPPLSVAQAQQKILAVTPTMESESVALSEAPGRVLAVDITATRDLPPADNSAMDGYAIRAADLVQLPATLPVIDDIAAGRLGLETVRPGTAIRIMTGGILPAGADAVVPVEWTDAGATAVRIDRAAATGLNIRRRGEDMQEGATVLSAGTTLAAGEIGVLAMLQRQRVEVTRKVRLTILSTGDELVSIDAALSPALVPDSNGWALASATRSCGAEVMEQAIVPDELEATIQALRRGVECGADFVVSTGGVSVGARDFVKDALDALGAETIFWRVDMKPGKPVLFAKLGTTLFFALPGNPVSALVSFALFVAPAILRAAGLSGDVTPPRLRATLTAEMRSKGDRPTFNRVRLAAIDGALSATPARAQGSGVTSSMIGANGLAVIDRGVTHCQAGDEIDVLLIAPLA